MAETSGSAPRIVMTPAGTVAAPPSGPPAGRRGPVSATLALVRWPNALLAALGVVAGAWWVGGPVGSWPVAGAMLAAVALTAVANAYNDSRDAALDAIAHPGRPVPRGELTVGDARRVAVAAAVVAVTASAAAGWIVAATTPFVIALMVLYSTQLKRRGLAGNLTVAVVASLPFAYGGSAVGAPVRSLPLVGLALPLHLAREIAKDLDDAAADAGWRRTLPVAWGASGARRTLALALGVFAGELLLFVAGRPVLAVAAAPALWACAVGARRAFSGAAGAPRLFKIAMLCAVAALFVARP